MFKLNNKKANTEPCGNPLFRVLCLLLLLSITSMKYLLLSILFIIPLKVLYGITRKSLVMSPSHNTMSYAAMRSIKTAADFRTLSNLSLMFVVSDKIWSRQFLFSLNPACSIGIVLFMVSAIQLYINLSKSCN